MSLSYKEWFKIGCNTLRIRSAINIGRSSYNEYVHTFFKAMFLKHA